MKTPKIIIISIFSSILLVFLSVLGIICILKCLPGYVAGIKLFVTHCFSLKLLPLAIFPMFRFSLPCIIAAVLIIGFFRAIYKSTKRVKINRSFLKNFIMILPDKSAKLKKIMHELKLEDKICLFKSDDLSYAFSSGILRPKIYLSTGLITNFSEKELKTVILHEKFHIKHKDIIKLSIISFLEDWLFFLPVYHWLTRCYYEMIEKIADDRVVEFYGEPLNLAQTLLKIAKLNKKELPMGIGPSVIGHNSLAKRIKWLLNKEDNITLPSKYSIYGNFLIITLLFIPFFFRVFLSSEKVFHKFENTISNICGEHDEAYGDYHHAEGVKQHSHDIFGN